MPKAPEACELVLCKRYVVDPQLAEQSLVGLLHGFQSPTFPFRAPDFTVYAALTGGKGEGRMVLELMRLETEEVVHSFTKWYACLADGLVATFEKQFRGCVFPAPGRYAFALKFEGEDVARRVVDIIKKR
jgi:hypothetical protein